MVILTGGCALLGLLASAAGHVSLSYPKARQYDLDFLDSYRTSGDCGMEAGEERTVLEAGSQLNVTWSLGYAHRGGFKLELVDGDAVTMLYPENPDKEWEDVDVNQQSQMVTLPETECSTCYLRLQRQAGEWGEKYLFRSCADLTLVAQSQDTTGGPQAIVANLMAEAVNLFWPPVVCSGHGELDASPAGGSGCKCEAGYTGSVCQYTTGCRTDDDCNGSQGQGVCVVTDNVVFEDRRCYCSQGWFGDECEKQSDFTSPRFQKSEYIRTPLANHLGGPTLYWRIHAGEIEMIVEADTTSWVGLGWRPSDLTKRCQEFPAGVSPPKGTDFHPMDCTDMVIGMAKDGRGAIADYYTRDRSTPRRDAFWGGSDDLRSGLVYESDGKTVMMFRKPVKGGTADQNFGGSMEVIWATGQDTGFYKADQLKYHGSSGQRGKATLNFFSAEQHLNGTPVLKMSGLVLIPLFALLF